MAFKEKVPSNIFQIGVSLVLVALISWLIAITVQYQTYHQDVHGLKAELADLQDFEKEYYFEHRQNRHWKSKDLVNAFLASRWSEISEDNFSKMKDQIISYVSDDIYQKVEEYGLFFKFDDAMNFNEAKEACGKIKGHLVEFNEMDSNVQVFLREMRRYYGANGYWIGLTDEETEGSFKWLHSGNYYSKTPNAMNIWSRGEPNNLGSENCVTVAYQMHYDYYDNVSINDVSCDSKFTVICKKDFS